MKVKTIVIGEYQISPSIPFSLYQFTLPYVTPPLQKSDEYVHFYCLEDLFSLFDLQFIQPDLAQLFKSSPECFCKDTVKQQHFIQTHLLLTIALNHQLYLLADLCRFNENQLISGAAVQILKSKTILRLHRKPIIQYIQLPNVTALNGTEWIFNDSNSSPRMKRLSVDETTFSSSTPHIMSSPIITPQPEDIQLPPKPSTLLLKRLAPKNGHKKNLTILTPSYNKDNQTTIHSAPLKIPPRTKTGKVTKKTTLSPPHLKAPATAIVARFPSPPIVPSQQPAWSQYRPKPTVKTATLPYFPHHQHNPASSSLTQKQKFLQPFEYLYDNLEQTRSLKMALDDQIRRSSGLIQQLQKINIPSIVQKETETYVQKEFKDRIQECTQRIEKLEYTATTDIPISPAISPPPPTCSIDVVLSQLLKRIDHLESKLK